VGSSCTAATTCCCHGCCGYPRLRAPAGRDLGDPAVPGKALNVEICRTNHAWPRGYSWNSLLAGT
jgi:hypothetical protein